MDDKEIFKKEIKILMEKYHVKIVYEDAYVCDDDGDEILSHSYPVFSLGAGNHIYLEDFE